MKKRIIYIHSLLNVLLVFKLSCLLIITQKKEKMYGIIYTCMHSLLNVLLELKISMTYYLTQTNDKVYKDLLITNNEKDKKSLHRTSFFFCTN